jgi:flagellar hook-associated protein 3 FlgL
MINATGNRMTAEIRRQSALAEAISDTQISVSTGLRMQRASDDPLATAQVSTLRRTQADELTWAANMDRGRSLAAQADGVAQMLNDRLARVMELTISGASATMPQSARSTIAAEIDSIAAEVAALSDTKAPSGQPLFPTGPARSFRFAEGVEFAPVPDRSALFERGGQSITQQITDIATAIRTQDPAAVTQAQALVDHGSDAAAAIGITAARLDRLSHANASRRVDVSAARSKLEDTDLSVAIAKLNAQTVTLEAAQAAFARINRTTLFDILR